MNNCCVCGSQQTFALCCEPFIKQRKVATTPEQLMRSRYSAYALGAVVNISLRHGLRLWPGA